MKARRLLPLSTAALSTAYRSICYEHTVFKRTSVLRTSSATSKHSSGGSTSSGGGDCNFQTVGATFRTAEEDAQDKELEEEEFSSMQRDDDVEYMPLAHRLARKADALDAELRRIKWVLVERRQLLLDTKAATVRGRATRADQVLARVTLEKNKKLFTAQGNTPAEGGRTDDTVSSNAKNHFGAASSTTSTTQRISWEDLLPYARWTGSASFVPQQFAQLRRYISERRGQDKAAASEGKQLRTLTEDIDYIRRGRSLNQLNYYSRLNLTPARHVGHAGYQIIWNMWASSWNALGALIYGVTREVRNRGSVGAGIVMGTPKSAAKALIFVFYGFVLSPIIHVHGGLTNSVYGPLNFYTSRYFFDSLSGRWMRCTVLDSQLLMHELQREKRLIRSIGRQEFARKRMNAESKWGNHLKRMGFTLEAIGHRLGGKKGESGSTVSDPYEVLNLKRNATQKQIKAQYKKLAMIFHPDVVNNSSGGSLSEAELRKAQHRFEEISTAYQTLSNAEKRRAYDLGGSRGLHTYESRHGQFMARTPEQMVQGIFGGEGFRRLLFGETLRSHWHLRFEAQVSVSLHEFEELQCIRARQMALELAAMLDVHAKRPTTGPYHGAARATRQGTAVGTAQQRKRGSADPFSAGMQPQGGTTGKSTRPGSRVISSDLHDSIQEELGDKTKKKTTTQASSEESSSPYVLRPGNCEYNCFSKEFEDRCDQLVKHFSSACFGPELLFEVGESYVINAQRALHITPFYAPKMLLYRKISQSVGRVYKATMQKINEKSKEEVQRLVMAEYFQMEYDNVVADVHLVLRATTQMVLQDCAVSEEVRKKRCYAMWLLGEKMMAKGTRWNHGKRDEADLAAYVQQAAHSSASTSKPPAF